MSAQAVAARHAALVAYARECRREATEMDQVVTTDVGDTNVYQLLTEALNAEAAAFQLRREVQGERHQEDAA